MIVNKRNTNYTHSFSRLILLFSMLISCSFSLAQAPGCPNISLEEDISLNCETPNITLTADFLASGETSTYDVTSIPFNPPYSFATGNPIFIGIDDHFSDVIDLPFDFCFYGNTFNQIIVGANGLISFDVILADSWCAWEFNSSIPTPSNDPWNGIQTGIYNNSINGAYHDMDPSQGGNIYYDILGEYPCRTFVVNWYNVPQYSCTNLETTQQIVIYETTNVIEVYIDDKPTCNDWWFGWNDGNAVIGIQNENGTEGITPPGRNTGDWTASNEAWRFTPNGTPNYVINWYDDAFNLLGNGNTLDISPSSTTTYTAEITYTNCNGNQIIESDDITVFTNNIAPDLSVEDIQICEGEEFQLFTLFITDNNNTNGTISYHTGNPATNSNEINYPTVTPTATTTYYVLKTTEDNCEDIEPFTIIVNPLPIIDAGLDFAVCGLTTNLNGISSTSNNTWSANDITFANINNLNTDITANNYGVQTITLNAEEDGCLATPDNVNITFLEPPIVDAGSDIDICSGENTQLNGYGNGNILWSPSTGLNDPTLPNPIVSGITDSTLYTLTVTNASVESVYNGDFELGNTGFYSDYYTPTFSGSWGLLSSEGTYTVDNNGADAHVNFVGFDNTNPPNGNFLIVNGASSLNTSVWCQDIIVAPNTNYEFSTWVSTMVASNPAVLEFSINGVLLGNPFTAPNTTNSWEEYTATWFSDLNTAATICIVNQNTTGDGNDFGIDDISFNAVCSSTDEVWVNVQPIIEAINQTPSVCEDEFNLGNSEVDLTLLEPYLSTNSNAMVDWFNNSNLTSPIINPDNFIVSENQTVYAALSAPLSCENTAVVTYNINPMPEANNIIASFCEDLENDILIDLTTYENQISSNATTINWFNLLGQSINTNYPLLESGILLAQITNNFNCENAAKLILELNSTPNISAITSDEICQSENYNLASININDNNNTGGSISFHSESPANPSNQISSLVSPNTSSLYYILSTTEEGCKDETSFNLTVNPIPTPDAGSDESVCGLSTILNASLSIGVDNNWANISDVVFSNSENPTTTATVSEFGTYSFIWEETSEFGCYNNSTVNIEFVAPPTTNSNITNISICPGEEVFLQASAENYTSFAWNSSGSGTFSDYLSENTIYTPSNEDVSNNGSSLTFTALNSPCPPSSSEISLNIHNTPIASIEGSGDLCANTDSTAAIILYTNNGVSPYELSITHNGVDWIEHTIYGSSDTIFTEEEGFYTISSLNDTHCSGISSGEISIYYRPIPYAEFSFNPSVAFLGDSEISFYNHSLLADSFTWSFGDDTYNNLEFNPTHLYTDTGTFTISLVVSNEFGCEDSVRHTVIINPNFHFFVPNVFTPNGDLQNDVFSGKGDGIAYFEMTIFNRWGGAIFNTNDMEKGWDGTPLNSSEVSPNGVYSYKITVTDLLGKIHTYTGEVSLLR